jgi:nicotinamidase-related amidase
MSEASSSQRFVLLVIDMLNDFLDKWDPARRQALCAGTNQLVAMMREFQQPVIWVRQEFDADLHDAFLEMRTKNIRTNIKGTPGCEIVPELTVAPSEKVVVKKRYSAFYGTDVDNILAQLKPQRLVLAGINTHACIRMTAIDAYQRDLRVILAADCVDSYDREHHTVSLRYMSNAIAEVMTNDQIRRLLEA